MIYTEKIEKAINFAIQTHEINNKQKRKGKDVPQIVHPFSVALILSRVSEDEDLIIAGFLHDTIEDCSLENNVTKEIIEENFGKKVSEIVYSVTEEDATLEWEERKAKAIERIDGYSKELLLLKSADLISNMREVYFDYQTKGDDVFKVFSRGKEPFLKNFNNVAKVILSKWEDNPLKEDLLNLFELSRKMNFNPDN